MATTAARLKALEDTVKRILADGVATTDYGPQIATVSAAVGAETSARISANSTINASITALQSAVSAVATYDDSHTVAFIAYSASWPVRTTATANAAQVVIWYGPAATPPTIGGSYAKDNLDLFVAYL